MGSIWWGLILGVVVVVGGCGSDTGSSPTGDGASPSAVSSTTEAPFTTDAPLPAPPTATEPSVLADAPDETSATSGGPKVITEPPACDDEAACAAGYTVDGQFVGLDCTPIKPLAVTSIVVAEGQVAGRDLSMNVIDGIDPSVMMAINIPAGGCSDGADPEERWSAWSLAIADGSDHEGLLDAVCRVGELSPTQQAANGCHPDEVNAYTPVGDVWIAVPPPQHGETEPDGIPCELTSITSEMAFSVRVTDSTPTRVVAPATELGYTSQQPGATESDTWTGTEAELLAETPGLDAGSDIAAAGGLRLVQIPDAGLQAALDAHGDAPVVALGTPLLLDGTAALFVTALGRESAAGFEFLWPCATTFQQDFVRGMIWLNRPLDQDSAFELLLLQSDDWSPLMQEFVNVVY